MAGLAATQAGDQAADTGAALGQLPASDLN